VVLARSRLVAFVACRDLRVAGDFYGDVLGLPLVETSDFALVFDAGGTELRVTRVDTIAAAPYTVLGWCVESIEHAVDRLVAAGVQFARYPGMAQNERGIWTSPGGSRIAWFHDPDANTLSLQQPPQLTGLSVEETQEPGAT
jgi:catechol 2,3-dioxygenase-like lactoylglutathione lyase family enzyme